MTHTPISAHLTDANADLVTFMETKLDSLAKWDLIQFFYHNPSLVGPAPKIASLTGRDVVKVERELKDMATKGLLDVQDKSGVRLYKLAQDSSVRQQIRRFIHACDDRQFREAAIYHAVAGKR